MILSVKHAKYSEPTETLFDAILNTSDGDMFFAYVPNGTDEISVYLDSEMGNFEIEPYVGPITLEEAKEIKTRQIGNDFNIYVTWRTPISLGFDMQFNQRDVSMVDGAVRFLEMTNGTEGYLTDADNINHYGLTVNEMKQALVEITGAYLGAHSYKQQLRDAVDLAETKEQVDLIIWEL